MAEEIINRVANSPLKSIDIDEYMDTSEKVFFDIKEGLFQGMLLREKDFRQYIKDHDWMKYAGKNVGVFCSEDAIIPTWAFMLVATKLHGVANLVVLGHEEELEKALIDRAVEQITTLNLDNAKVVIKGCGDIKSRDYAYFKLTNALLPRVSSLMYGEPCSTVPVYKRKTS